MATDTILNEKLLTDDIAAVRTAPDSATSVIAIATALAPMIALAACSGGGGTTPTPSPAPTPAPTAAAITKVQASRFLGQATMGATDAMIANVQAKSFDGWLSAQFALPRATAHWDWLVAQGYSASTYINSEAGFDPTMWRQLIVEPDQLRQRVGFALSEIMVVGIAGINLNWKQFAAAGYVDVLLDNAFGNFRTLLDAITTNAAMASYLTFLGNRKANAATGAVPDENYARELMQLFTLGLYQLNMDGTNKLSAGNPLETYVQADVSGLARVFTGLSLANGTNTTPDRYRLPR
ncbi:hypothetical protein BH10PSE14_BH10PSE14_37900 [soil metagenome]